MRIRPATWPLVSCIMPTANRHGFVPYAVRWFWMQDYRNRELIIVDDGSNAVRDLIPKDARIRYLRLPLRRSVGEKRNIACRMARGEIIVHWDDDDWAASWRVSYQVQELIRTGADICGIDRVLFLGPTADQAWHYLYPEDEPAWVHGGSLCYRRDLWLKNPFPDVSVAEDSDFMWSDFPKKIVSLKNTRFYVGLIHADNTSPKPGRNARWRRYSPARVRRLLGHGWQDLLGVLLESSRGGCTAR